MDSNDFAEDHNLKFKLSQNKNGDKILIIKGFSQNLYGDEDEEMENDDEGEGDE
mgnify:CR=1 FL=1